MTLLIIIFGALILVAGLVIILKPAKILAFLRYNQDKLSLQIFAVLVRLTLGVLLIAYASVSKFPLIIEILGWLSIFAAIALAVMGRQNFRRLMSWALSKAKALRRIGGVFGAIFGAFLIYAFL